MDAMKHAIAQVRHDIKAAQAELTRLYVLEAELLAACEHLYLDVDPISNKLRCPSCGYEQVIPQD